MPTSESLEATIRQIRDQSAFLNKLLIDELGWPISNGTQGIEDITYEWSLEELSASEFSGKVVDNRALQIGPLVDHQPWGIFFLEFTDERPFVTGRGMARLLRAVLDGLKPKRTRDAHLASWKQENLLFICTYQYRHFRFAHFKPPDNGSRSPQLATFGWEYGEPARTVCEFNLLELAWPHRDVESDSAKWVKKWAKAFDVEKVTKHFFEDYKDVFEQVEELVTDLSDSEDRRLFTQLLFNRLLFLRFIERKGWLRFQGRTDYLRALYQAGGISGESFYSSRIHPLFFEGLAILGKQKSDAIGEVPYLNGGLFDKNPKLDSRIRDLPDIAFKPIIGERGLFYRYNFTVQESTPLDVEVAVDPEMLGKVFERLVTARERKEKGSYYTPRQIVSFMCRETLKGYLGGCEELVDDHTTAGIGLEKARELLCSIRDVKIIDPACGSGAYLLGMLHELHHLVRLLENRVEEITPQEDYGRKLAIIQSNLYGVDNDEFAANIACLRLWLSLAVEYEGDNPPPLPNLDFKIGVGDSLLSPNPETIQYELFDHQRIAQIDRLKRQYSSTPDVETKKKRRSEIESLQEAIAQRQHSSVAPSVFNWTVDFAEVFVPRPAGTSIDGELNLGYKLAPVPKQGGFDIVIANPPYGIRVEDKVRKLFFSSKDDRSQSKDSYGIFIVRALQLLRPGSQFSFIVSNTWRTIKGHKPLRKRLIQEATIKYVLDLPRWVFEATVDTCILALEKGAPPDHHKLVAADLCSIPKGDWKTLSANLEAAAGGGPDVQTTTCARYTFRQSLIGQLPNWPFFVGSANLARYLTEPKSKRLGKTYTKIGGRGKSWNDDGICQIISGIKTGDNQRYLRKKCSSTRGENLGVVNAEDIIDEASLADATDYERKTGFDANSQCFVPLDKGESSDAQGGWLPNYFVQTEYFVDWSTQAVESMRSEPHSDLANPEFRFCKGITYSRTGDYAPTFRLSCGGILESKSCGLFTDDMALETLLGILCSRFVRYLAKIFVMHSVETSVGMIGNIPVRVPTPDIDLRIRGLISEIVAEQEHDPRYAYYCNQQVEIDAEVYSLYELCAEDIREVELWFCRRYDKLAKAQGLWDEVHHKYADHLKRSERILQKPPGYWKSHPILSMIAKGEGQQLELKESLEADAKTGQKHPTLVHEALRTVCAFANADGGTLLIGVSDDGEVKGLEKDYKFCGKRQNEDGFQLKLQNLVSSRLDPSPLDLVSISFEELPEGAVSRVDVQQSKDIIHLDKKEVWVRYGNQSRRLEGRELTDWIERRSSS